MRFWKSIGILVLSFLLGSSAATSALAHIEGGGEKRRFTKDFRFDECTWSTTGENPFFILVPGYRLVLEGEDEKEEVRVEITVLDEMENVGGYMTRVVEEREAKDGVLIEVSRNFFAICVETNSVFYFGEDVDICDEGLVPDGGGGYTCLGEEPSHEGAWRAFEPAEEGEGVNLPGIIMPGTILLGSRYHQETAPGVAMDRAENLSISETVESPAAPGPDFVFTGCLKVKETTPLEPNAKDLKFYAPWVGLVVDGPLVLTDYGY